MVDVSVVTCAYRPGGIDILLAGMRDQTYPRDKWEVILVDRRYERRRAEVRALAQEYGVTNLIHAPEHRRNGKWGATASAYNTGFALARGEIVILLLDWAYAPPGWIERHLAYHTVQPTYVVATYRYHAIGITRSMYDELAGGFLIWSHIVPPWEEFEDQPRVRTKIPFDLTTQDRRVLGTCVDEDAVLRGEVFDEVSVFADGLFDPAWIARMPELPRDDPGLRRYFPGQIVEAPTAHLKNESMPRAAVYAINGLDVWGERGGRMQVDTDFGLRMARLGLRMIWDTSAMARCINPRHGICRTMPFGQANDRVDGRWSLADCEQYAYRREMDVRRGLFLAAPAPYTMDGLAKKLDPWRTADVIDTSGIDVPDREFFGRDIWPDSPYVEGDPSA